MQDVLLAILKAKISVEKLHHCAIVLVLPMGSVWIVNQVIRILEEIVLIGIVIRDRVIYASNA